MTTYVLPWHKAGHSVTELIQRVRQAYPLESIGPSVVPPPSPPLQEPSPLLDPPRPATPPPAPPRRVNAEQVALALRDEHLRRLQVLCPSTSEKTGGSTWIPTLTLLCEHGVTVRKLLLEVKLSLRHIQAHFAPTFEALEKLKFTLHDLTVARDLCSVVTFQYLYGLNSVDDLADAGVYFGAWSLASTKFTVDELVALDVQFDDAFCVITHAFTKAPKVVLHASHIKQCGYSALDCFERLGLSPHIVKEVWKVTERSCVRELGWDREEWRQTYGK